MRYDTLPYSQHLSVILTFIVRVLGAIGGLLLVFILAKLCGAECVGLFATSQALIVSISILAVRGENNALMGIVVLYPRDSNIPNLLLKRSIRRSLALGFLAVLILLLFKNKADILFSVEGISKPIFVLGFSIPPLILISLCSGYLKGLKRPVLSAFFEYGIFCFVVALNIFLCSIFIDRITLFLATFIHSITAWLMFVLLYSINFKKFGNKKYQDDPDIINTISNFNKTANSFFIIDTITIVYTLLCLMIFCWMISPAEIGMLRASQQIAASISFILIVINSIIPPIFAELFVKKKVDEIRNVARKWAAVGCCFSAPIAVIIISFSDELLGSFGSDFRQANFALKLLSISQFINVATGSVGYLLSMTGHHALQKNIIIFTYILGLLPLIVLSNMYGLNGAALALSSISIIQNFTYLFYVKKRLGIEMLFKKKIS